MKKMFVILMVLCALLGVSGCSTAKSYKAEDYEIYDIISELDEMKRDIDDEDVTLDYEVKRGINDKYIIKFVIKFEGHTVELKSISFTMDEFKNGFETDMSMDDIFTCKVDGKKFDYETTMVLLDHYYYGN